MAHLIDTPNAVAVMPVAGAAGTPGWFQDTDPAHITRLDADWGNMVQGELKAIVELFGGTLVKGTVNQIATALLKYVLTNGRFSTSLYAGADPATPSVFLTKITAETILGSAYFGQVDTGLLLATLGIETGPVGGRTFTVSPLGNVHAAGYIIADGDITAKGKIKNAAGADVVFDDGVTVEAALGVGTNLTVGGKIGEKNAAVSEAYDDCITVDWTSGGADHLCSDFPVTTHAAPNASFVVKLNNSGGATTINPGDAILVDVSAIEDTGQTLLGAHAEVFNLDVGTYKTTVALRGLRFAAGLALDSSGNRCLALTYVGRGNRTVAGATLGQAYIRVRLQYATLTATT